MKYLVMIIGVFIIISSTKAQGILNLYPSEVKPLDFSEKTRKEWILRDTLLSKIQSGEKKYHTLTVAEEDLFHKYSESCGSMWEIICDGENWYAFGGGPTNVTASSFLKPQGANLYEPMNAHDLNYKNAWVEGVSGYGIGEYLLYHFSPYSPRITDIIIVNGYVKSLTAWNNNSRVKTLKMYIDDKPYAILNLKDEIANQVFKVSPIGNSPDKWKEIEKTKTWTIKFEIQDVYKGLKYDDVAISEIYFHGLDALCLAKGTKILMADKSTQNIEDVKVGDSITYLDLNTKQLKTSAIEKLEKAIHHELVTYRFESGLEITSTQDHPFRIEKKGWASLKPENSVQYKGFENISKIEIGDMFLTSKSTDKLLAIDYLKGSHETFTISKTNAGDNFVANGLIVGIEELKE